MSYPNRAPVRKVIASLLSAALTGKAQVFDYLVIDMAGKAPFVCVTSAGTGPQSEGYGDYVTDLFYEVRIACVYAAAGWTAAQCEDQADELCKIVLDTINSNNSRAIDVNGVGWTLMQMDRPTLTAVEPVGGISYRTEIIPVAVQVTLG